MAPSLLLLLLPLLLSGIAEAIVPGACVHNVTRRPAVCCPIPAGHRLPCGYPKRGVCRKTLAHRAPRYVGTPKTFKEDVRVDWPERLFQRSCQCVGRYWGMACDQCRYGYEGADCQHRVVHVRRSILSYTAKERQRWLSVLEASRRVPSDLVKVYGLRRGGLRRFRKMSVHEAVVNVHFFASNYRPPFQLKNRKDCGEATDMNHNTATFILWHRYFVLWWERQLRAIAERQFGWSNFTVPYWDYTDAKNCSVCTPDLICVPVRHTEQLFPSTCRMAKWISYCKGSDCDNCESPKNRFLTRSWEGYRKHWSQRYTFPTSKEITFALKCRQYAAAEFCHGGIASYIESGCSCLGAVQMHNLVHNMFPGDMSTTVSSPNDPLFLLHHSQLDRLLHRWILAAKPTPDQIPPYQTQLPQICPRCGLVGFLPSVTAVEMLVDLRQLGVDYDSLSFGTVSETVPISSSAESYIQQVCGHRKKSVAKKKKEKKAEKKQPNWRRPARR